MPSVVWRVVAPHFVAALVTRGSAVLSTAPILSWTKQRNLTWLAAYFRSKGWTFKVAGVEGLPK